MSIEGTSFIFLKACRELKIGGFEVPKSYEDQFRRTLSLFLHQRVFDPRSGTLTHLKPLPVGTGEGVVVDDDFLGPPLGHDVVKGIALGGCNTH